MNDAETNASSLSDNEANESALTIENHLSRREMLATGAAAALLGLFTPPQVTQAAPRTVPPWYRAVRPPSQARTKDNSGITSHTARVNGINIHYLRAGQGDPVVLLHGMPQHSHQWRKIMPALAERYTVIAPDQRGAGGSTITSSGYDKRTLADDIYQLVQSLGLGPIYLVGYDLGGGTAYQYAHAHPGDVRALAILEFVLPGFGLYESAMVPNPTWDSGSNWQLGFFTVPDIAEHFLRGQERDLLSWFFWHTAYNSNAVSAEDFEVYVRALSKPGALRACIEYYAAVWRDAAQNQENAQYHLEMPVLALGGEHSGREFVLQGMQPLAVNVRGGVIERAGHWLTDERPDAVIEQLLTFFGEVR